MLRIVAGIALLVTGPLTAAPILIDGYGVAVGGSGHVDLSGEGVSFSAALASDWQYGEGSCRAGALCNITFNGGGAADGPYNGLTEVIGTYLGQTITPSTFAHVSASFDGSFAVHGFPYPSDHQYLSVPVSADWTGLIRFWPDGPESAGMELEFAGAGPAQLAVEAIPNQFVCAIPPGGWTQQPPQSCFATNFVVVGLEGPFTGTLEQVPEPSTWTAFGAAGLMAVVGAVGRRRSRRPSRP